MTRGLICLLALLACSRPCHAGNDALIILYFERPPYYATTEGLPGGFLVNLTREIMAEAGIGAVFQEMPARRIIEVIKTSDKPVCSIGWFKTPEREEYARFSIPIYRDQPLAAAFLASGRGPKPGAATFKEVAADPDLVMGLNSAFSYGEKVDAMLKGLAAPPVKVNATQEQLMRMLSARRFDYMLVNPEEAGTLACLAGLSPEDLAEHSFPDLPKGNLRHLMFSQNTPAGTIGRVNEAIRRLAPLEQEAR
ncbi:MAG: substrate-binding periplasmic protein [Thermodesulfobacteriota bacterium]